MEGTDAVLLVEPTGRTVRAWSGDGVEREMAAVMSATLVASVQAIEGAVGRPASSTIGVTTTGCRMLFARTGDGMWAIVVAPLSTPAARVRAAGRRIARVRRERGRRTAKPGSRDERPDGA